ncbi:alkylmercury lyase family protein [Nocardia sp. NPDC058058]|uniref:alkylmercury lyase family protein n=1 Tax=Nocardia sp. NPDC058058 TaxID=3346317 RepID=UPI0036D7E017
MATLNARAHRIRDRIMSQVREFGTVPTMAELRTEFDLTDDELRGELRNLEGAICVAVQDDEHADSPVFQDEPLANPQPALGEIVYARPFAAFANHYRISVDGVQRWFAECAVEACAISGQFPGAEVVVDSVCRQTGVPIRLIGRDGVLIDFEPRTLRVHLGYPVREMPHRVVGWCDYNSFFASEDAARQWRDKHPDIHGITRAPEQMAAVITEVLAPGRLNHDYQPRLSMAHILRNAPRFGLTRESRSGIPVPDSFWLPTPKMLVDWRRHGLGNFIRLGL